MLSWTEAKKIDNFAKTKQKKRKKKGENNRKELFILSKKSCLNLKNKEAK